MTALYNELDPFAAQWYGNAINAEVAATFIRAAMEAMS